MVEFKTVVQRFMVKHQLVNNNNNSDKLLWYLGTDTVVFVAIKNISCWLFGYCAHCYLVI